MPSSHLTRFLTHLRTASAILCPLRFSNSPLLVAFSMIKLCGSILLRSLPGSVRVLFRTFRVHGAPILKSPLLKINLEPDVNTLLAPGPRGLHLPQAPSLAWTGQQELPEDSVHCRRYRTTDTQSFVSLKGVTEVPQHGCPQALATVLPPHKHGVQDRQQVACAGTITTEAAFMSPSRVGSEVLRMSSMDHQDSFK